MTAASGALFAFPQLRPPLLELKANSVRSQ